MVAPLAPHLLAPDAQPAILFFVHGQPVTQGSKRLWHQFRADGHCVVSMSEAGGPALKEWRALMATAAKRAMRDRMPFDGPVRVTMNFSFPRPKVHTLAQRAVSWVWGNRKWDLDKLQRACFDSLSAAAVVHDDSQIAAVYANKIYTEGRERPGVVVSVETLL